MLGRWIKCNEEYSKITFYDTKGWTETENGQTFDLHCIGRPDELKKKQGEELMPRGWEPDKTFDYEIY